MNEPDWDQILRQLEAAYEAQQERATVPFKDYRELEDKYEELDFEFYTFKSDIASCYLVGDFKGIEEVLKEKKLI